MIDVDYIFSRICIFLRVARYIRDMLVWGKNYFEYVRVQRRRRRRRVNLPAPCEDDGIEVHSIRFFVSANIICSPPSLTIAPLSGAVLYVFLHTQ